MEGTLFINGFLSYLVVYFVFIVTVVIAFLIGFQLRKSKNAKTVSTGDAEGTEGAEATQEKKAAEK